MLSLPLTHPFAVQVTFSPSSGGSYEAVVAVYAHLVVSSSLETNKPVANVILKAVAEEPRLEIQTASSHSGILRNFSLSVGL